MMRTLGPSPTRDFSFRASASAVADCVMCGKLTVSVGKYLVIVWDTAGAVSAIEPKKAGIRVFSAERRPAPPFLAKMRFRVRFDRVERSGPASSRTKVAVVGWWWS